jgi:hypothetical protein
MLRNQKVLKSRSDLDGEIAIDGRNINDRCALPVSAQFVAQKWKRLQNLIHESAPHGFGQVVEETLRAQFLDQLVAVVLADPHRTAAAPNDRVRPQPAPAGPNAGTGHQPKISRGERTLCASTLLPITAEGRVMLPVPRTAPPSRFSMQIDIAPLNATFE